MVAMARTALVLLIAAANISIAAAAAGNRQGERTNLRHVKQNGAADSLLSADRVLETRRYYLIPSTGYCQDEMYAPQWITAFFSDWNECCRTGWIVEKCMAADPGTSVSTTTDEQQLETTITTTTTTTTSTSSKAEEPAEDLEQIPLRFSIMGLPTDIDNFGAFRDTMTQQLKIALTSIAEEIGMKVTSIESNYDLVSTRSSVFNRNLQSEAGKFSSDAQTIKLFYDVEVVKDPSQKYGPVVIRAIQDRHDEMLRELQASSTYYLSNFDLCTTTRAGLYDDSDFDVCTLEHEIIPLKFSSRRLHPNIDQSDLNEELLKIYSDILAEIPGLEVAGLSLNRVDESSNSLDVYMDVDIVAYDGRNWKSLVESELAKEAKKNQISEQVQQYLKNSLVASEGGESLEVCVDDQGMISMECTSVKSTNLALPLWAIYTITGVCVAIVLCIAISLCICAYQDNKDEEQMMHNIKSFVKDPEEWRQGVFEKKKRKSKLQKVAPSPKRRRHTSYERRKRHSHRRPRHRRYSYSPERKRGAMKTERKVSRDIPQQLPALPPPQYDQLMPAPLPALPPPQYDRLMPAPQNSTQFLALPPPIYDQAPTSEEEILAVDGPVYCDDEEVNRPDPPMEPGPTLMLMNRPSHGSEQAASDASESQYLAFMNASYRDYH